MTPAEWKVVEDRLAHSFGHATLVCDSRRLTLEVRMVAARRYEIFPFVDGVFKGAWLIEDCEERRRFLRPSPVRLWSPSQRKSAIKKLGLRRARKLLELDKTTTLWAPSWPSFGPLKRHLIANNKQIELAAE